MIVDLFAGPGGWDIAAHGLGLNPVGIEWDADACKTRAAAGLTTIRADLNNYDAPDIELDGLIGSPPCPLFSPAGNCEGVDWLPHLCEVAHGHAELADNAPAEAGLSLAPLRWTLRHRPRWVTLEQVPAVLPLWEACAARLRTRGYSAWTGVLNAADYGVPQTRRRAILIARLDGHAQPPEPTHSKDPQPSLFGPELKPWVSMAQSLGWGPGWTVNQGTAWAAKGANKRAPEFDLSCDLPAPTFTGKSRHQWWCNSPGNNRHSPVRLTMADALTLQSFPSDYPVQGFKTVQGQQVGNAVPPQLAHHILRTTTT